MAILILTAYDDPVWIDELMRAGAGGCILKSDDFSLRLPDAIRAVLLGAAVFVESQRSTADHLLLSFRSRWGTWQ